MTTSSTRSAKLVVVGASLAGLRAVEAARKAGYDGDITLVGDEPHPPYNRLPLSKGYLDKPEAPPVEFTPAQRLRDELGVDLRLGAPARALEPNNNLVVVGDTQLPYDALIIATGSTPRALPQAAGISGIHGLRTLEDAQAIRAAIAAGGDVVIVGCGFIGSEVASVVRKAGGRVTIIEASTTPLARAVGVEMGARLAQLHQRAGTDLRLGVSVAKFDEEGGVLTGVQLSDGSHVRATLAVVGIGATPATGWLASSGLDVSDGVLCDETLRVVGHNNIFAAGDVARWRHPILGRDIRVEHWSNAADHGTTAGRNAVSGAAAEPYSGIPYFWSDWGTNRIQFVGTASDAEEVVLVEDGAERWVALYRRGAHLIGALAVNNGAVIMKYRRYIAERLSFAGSASEFPPR